MSAHVVAVACWASPGSAFAFDHRAHFRADRATTCTGCHPAADDADRRRPASHDHTACDTEACHASEFYGAKAQKTDLCLTCHLDRAYWSTATKVRPFPAEKDLDRRDFYAEFSHKQHLKRGGPVAERDMTCTHCHKDVSESTHKAERVMHEACAACHNEKQHETIPMSKCKACHKFRTDEHGRPEATGPALANRPARVTGAFDHFKHRFDRRRSEEARVGCDACHPKAARAETLGSIVATQGQTTMVKACGACHKRGQRTAAGKRLFTVTGSCTNCHTQSFVGALTAAPPDHRG